MYDPTTGRARIASAGHPRRCCGTRTAGSRRSGRPRRAAGCRWLRVSDDGAGTSDGATLALYTDGLVEARGRDIETGWRALREELASATGPLEAAATASSGTCCRTRRPTTRSCSWRACTARPARRCDASVLPPV
ncbi:SpoIIE family protein phosphatase [Streptomyces coeruleoprunus]|uniref:SpoIIE family protein phosphatase n=1 Tax=Streptomyces coeruleoprunus TaxID=285563 RepID=UPI003CD05669